MREIPPFKLSLVPLNDEAAKLEKFQWAGGGVGDRNRLGGKPDFLQGEEYPACMECGRKMRFYAQLDSLNDEFIIADCGMIYVFMCFECVETQSIIQSY
ncbi:hypothetical protein [Rhizobium sp. TRM95796]|uniref:hypothetical protein n=1 Tax=Rhizobium sp. TRM95796 TaxID=2979862 RepID=UPI0021E7A18A|nr:hypothetical protein [Rhizobium sp. TRM95796]MCV3765578.1 hypothetical protein [Rhizobium sp. TRM95796]